MAVAADCLCSDGNHHQHSIQAQRWCRSQARCGIRLCLLHFVRPFEFPYKNDFTRMEEEYDRCVVSVNLVGSQ